jgi:hypothetical protein
MPVIAVNKTVDEKRIIEKGASWVGGGVPLTPTHPQKNFSA